MFVTIIDQRVWNVTGDCNIRFPSSLNELASLKFGVISKPHINMITKFFGRKDYPNESRVFYNGGHANHGRPYCVFIIFIWNKNLVKLCKFINVQCSTFNIGYVLSLGNSNYLP